MRVISGTARGLKLIAPEGLGIRPTADRIKEALFNIISPYIRGANFLDIFSGTGSIGIEAISRGAFSVFIDSAEESFNIIQKNVKLAKFSEKSKIYNMDFKKAIKLLAKEGKYFDIIFIDPPYGKGFCEIAVKSVIDENILENDGIIICEVHKDDKIPKLQGLEILQIKEYKITKMVFLKKAI